MLAMRLAVPMVVAVGLDPIWFGGIVVCLMEVGAVTPPVGLNLFVVKASIPVSNCDGFRTAGPLAELATGAKAGRPAFESRQ